jgi:hypothetical protein
LQSTETNVELTKLQLAHEASQSLDKMYSTWDAIARINSLKLNSMAQTFLMQGVMKRYLSLEESWRWIVVFLFPN